jgi:hypothetical protein
VREIADIYINRVPTFEFLVIAGAIGYQYVTESTVPVEQRLIEHDWSIVVNIIVAYRCGTF